MELFPVLTGAELSKGSQRLLNCDILSSNLCREFANFLESPEIICRIVFFTIGVYIYILYIPLKEKKLQLKSISEDMKKYKFTRVTNAICFVFL